MKDDGRLALNYLERALVLDPQFAAASAAIADIYVSQFVEFDSAPFQTLRGEGYGRPPGVLAAVCNIEFPSANANHCGKIHKAQLIQL
jgi:hypothetical protein